MNTVNVFVGLDYHDRVIQVCILDADGQILANCALPNNDAVVDTFVRRFGGRIRAGIEACTGAAHLADQLAQRHGWDIRQAHPGFVARMRQSPDKSDWTDARVLADLTRVSYLPVVWLAPESVRDLRQLTRYRQHLVDTRRALKLRVRAMLRQCRVKIVARGWTRRWLAELAEIELPPQTRWVIEQHLDDLRYFNRKIEEVEKRLAEVTADDPLVAKLMQEKGIGLVTAAVMRAEVGSFDRFRNGKQLSRYCGLSPRNASSGTRQADAGLVKAGNVFLRTIVIEAAHRLARFDLRWKSYAQGLRARGKSGSVTAAAVANRWVRGLHHRMKLAAAA